MSSPPNLLSNGDFAGNFRLYNNNEQFQVALNWVPWWVEQKIDDPLWKNVTPAFVAVQFGKKQVQCVRSPWATHTAGLWQQMPATVGNEYEFFIEGQAWSSEQDEPASKVEPSDVNLQIGIDPTGGLDPHSQLIIWSKPINPISKWEELSVIAKAETPILTLFLKSAPVTPKQLQSIFWRNGVMEPIEPYKHCRSAVGSGDTYIAFEPEKPEQENELTITVSSLRAHENVLLKVLTPKNEWQLLPITDTPTKDKERYIWQATLKVSDAGMYDLRFVGDTGARLWAQRLIKVQSRDYLREAAQANPRGEPRTEYRRIYVLLPPTATAEWLEAAARGSFDGRYTIGFSADDAGIGNLSQRHVIAINPHHWAEPLTATWFHQHYPGTIFSSVVIHNPKDLEVWLYKWIPKTD